MSNYRLLQRWHRDFRQSLILVSAPIGQVIVRVPWEVFGPAEFGRGDERNSPVPWRRFSKTRQARPPFASRSFAGSTVTTHHIGTSAASESRHYFNLVTWANHEVCASGPDRIIQ